MHALWKDRWIYIAKFWFFVFCQMGLIPDEALFSLLDSALASDTVSTVDSIRELMGAGFEPLALVSQLATLITDILAGRCRTSFMKGKASLFIGILSLTDTVLCC
jgi:hypothetical protein